jgi:hypothetical protein
MLVADLALLAFETLENTVPEPADRQFILIANLAAATITVTILAILLAFSLRARFSRTLLQTVAAANALVLVGGSLLYDGFQSFGSLREAMQVFLQWSEALVCVALLLSIRTTNARAWFAKSEP